MYCIIQLEGTIGYKLRGVYDNLQEATEKYNILNKLYNGKLYIYDNVEEKFVKLVFDKDTNMFNIKGSSYSGEASINNIIGNWWNHKILQTDSQISPISGSIKEQVVTFIAREKIEQYGKIYEVDHFKLNSKDMSLPKDKLLDFDIWIDKKNSMIIRVSYSRMGNWEYRLKNFE